MILKDYTDGLELKLLNKPSPTTENSIYLNNNVRNQLLGTGSAIWRDIKITTEKVTYYDTPSFVLRVKAKSYNWTLILKLKDADRLKSYLRGEEYGKVS
jgi:hypothetical protein